MYNRNDFLDPNAKNILEFRKRQQEDRKKSMLKEQRARDLHQLETQLFFKKQEVNRLKSFFDRVRRESVVDKNMAHKERQDAESNSRQIKETESRIQQLDQEISRVASEVSDKIEKEKAILAEHQRNLEVLERNKREVETKKGSEKKFFLETMSRLMFFQKKEDQEAAKAEQKVALEQRQLTGTESSMKMFNQEITVLENKIRALRSSSQ